MKNFRTPLRFYSWCSTRGAHGNLVKKGVLYANHQEAKVTYYPALSSEEYYQQYTSQIIQTSFHGSLTSFISAFTGNKKLSASDKEELMDFLKGL